MKQKTFRLLFGLCFLLCCFGASALFAETNTEAKRPNIILILADDLGFSDLGCYGGEIKTPNLDGLASNGVRFTQFYNTTRCCPSRASINTGLYPHQAGIGGMAGRNTRRGYEGYLTDRCVTLAEVLKTAGYRTYMSGKWHMNNRPNPVDRGFDEFFGLLGGFTSFFEPKVHTRLPEGKPLRNYKEGEYYATDVFTDYALDFLADSRKKNTSGERPPFFLYLAYTAPHFPLHAPKEEIDKYAETYLQGWDKLREERYAKQLELGVFDETVKLTPRSYVPKNWVNVNTGWADKDNPAWDSIDQDRRVDLARRMAIFSAMIDRMDQNIGRVIEDLKQNGDFDNTLIIFLSDNGACAEWDPWGFDVNSGPQNKLHKGKDLEQMGQIGTYHSTGSGWANASNTPWRLYKHYIHEGGIRTPMIAHWPKGISRKGEFEKSVSHIIDFMPTVLELSGAKYPEEFKGNEIIPMEGRSLVKSFAGKQDEPRTLFWEHEGNRGMREGDTKLVWIGARGVWELYDLSKDPMEMNDLASGKPETVERMVEEWEDWARRALVNDEMKVDKKPGLKLEIDLTKPGNAFRDVSGKNNSVTREGDIPAKNGGGYFDGKSYLEIPHSETLHCENTPFTIEATVVPECKDGVILACGGSGNGYSLAIRDGKAVFAIASDGNRYALQSSETINGKMTIRGRLDANKKAALDVNGKTVATLQLPSLIVKLPNELMQIGLDLDSQVIAGRMPGFTGVIQNVRYSRGADEVTMIPGSVQKLEPRLLSKFARELDPKNPLPEYPRPQMERKTWFNLNGKWEYAILGKDVNKLEKTDGEIIVPFPVESALSGVGKMVGKENKLWYRKNFTIPEGESWKGNRILLHFGAVDWDAVVYVNGKEIGRHVGGYSPFEFDITDALNSGTEQELIVSVWDPSDEGFQPRGKQHKNPHGIWYTPVTGIWQTVWIEPVPETSIKKLKMLPDIKKGTLNLDTYLTSAKAGDTVEADVRFGSRQIAKITGEAGKTLSIGIKNQKLWTPDSPNLYDLKVSVIRNGKVIDSVDSYFGMREISLGKCERGYTRMMLNGKFVFQHGPLDQGWWPDGLYTAPSDKALLYDIEITKQLGFNMIRKHVKTEPARFYYHCDRLGMLVWQDFPNGDRHIGPQAPDIVRTPESTKNYENELTEMIDTLYNYPCIVVWVPFNEGWGQFDTNRILDFAKKLDPSRLIDGPSGWTDRKGGDMHDMHKYRGPGMFPPEENRASVLGEYGGLGLPIPGHTWVESDRNWGYGGNLKDRDDLLNTYNALNEKMHPLIAKGLSAAVYTQTTDVEVEVNGLMTYDREIIKVDIAKFKASNDALRLPPPETKTILPTAQEEAIEWNYTTSKPAPGWEKPDFDTSSWKKGKAGFGTGAPGSVENTDWSTDDIWIRTNFEITAEDLESKGEWFLELYYDEDSEIYVNGEKIFEIEGYSTSYEKFSIKNVKAFKPGKNIIAIHCKQTKGGQYIDAGIFLLIPPKNTNERIW